MTPKEKADELIDRFEPYVMIYGQDDVVGWLSEETPIFEYQKQCALIAVDFSIELNDFHIEFLQEVKQEIEKL
jgi:hypothetical protein